MQGTPAIQTSPQDDEEQRFRAALISSTAIHVFVLLASWLVPQLWPRPVIMPDITPVRVVQLPAAEPAAVDAPAEQPPPEPEEPEPLPSVTTEAEPIPRSIEDLRRQEELEEERRRQEELERQRAEERRRREEEERRRREEEERRAQPQRASRSDSEARPQSARRSEIAFTGTEADQQSFTVEEFPFAWYVARIRDLVARHWDPPTRGAHSLRLEADVFFRIGRDGRIVLGPELLESSGRRVFDQAALRAIAAADLPPLPREYEGNTLGVRFAFIEE